MIIFTLKIYSVLKAQNVSLYACCPRKRASAASEAAYIIYYIICYIIIFYYIIYIITLLLLFRYLFAFIFVRIYIRSHLYYIAPFILHSSLRLCSTECILTIIHSSKVCITLLCLYRIVLLQSFAAAWNDVDCVGKRVGTGWLSGERWGGSLL